MQGTITHRIVPVRKRIDQALMAEPRALLAVRLRLALILEILAVYAVILVRLRRQNVRELAARGRDSPGPAAERLGAQCTSEEHTRLARRLGWAVARTLSVLPTDSRCLVQSLVLKRLLAARSIPSQLVIGARSDGPFTAHAWVECNNIAVLPSRGYENSRLVEL